MTWRIFVTGWCVMLMFVSIVSLWSYGRFLRSLGRGMQELTFVVGIASIVLVLVLWIPA